MEEYLFVFLAEAVAHEDSSYRAGARHALLLWITAPNEGIARVRGGNVITKKGWLLPELKHGKQVSDPDLIDDDVLRLAAEEALETGHSIVVYKDEISPDA